MDKIQKQEFVKDTHDKLAGVPILLVVNYKGLTVPEMNELRGKVREAGAVFKVAKNRLVKIALEKTDYSELTDLFTGATAIAYSDDDVVSVSKAIVDFAKTNEHLEILGGGIGEKRLDDAAVKALSKMPTLDESRSKLIGLLNAPATKIASVLQAPARKMVGVVSEYSKKA